MRRKLLYFFALIASIVGICFLFFDNEFFDRGDQKPTTILVLIDGFPSHFLKKANTPNFTRLAQEGVQAAGVRSVFPAYSFPNQYTIATGLYPDNHGIISNFMYDPVLEKSFAITNTENYRHSHWWEGEPIWVTAQKQGVRSAIYYWPGSTASIQGIRPRYWKEKECYVQSRLKVVQAFKWLDMPWWKKPNLILLYFSEVDRSSHVFGPDTKQVELSIEDVDTALGDLLAGLVERGIDDKVNLIVTSDHGMVATDPDKIIFLDDYIDLRRVNVIEPSPVLMLNVLDKADSSVWATLRDAHPSLRVYRKPDFPREWSWGRHRRTPDIVGTLDYGWSVLNSRQAYEAGKEILNKGAHGYLDSLQSVKSIFFAKGPAFPEDVKADAFDNIHLYELMAHLMEIEPGENDGSLEAVRHLMKDVAPPRSNR